MKDRNSKGQFVEGREISKEERLRISKFRIGKKHSEETRKKLSLKASNRSEEIRNKYRDAKLGKKLPKEHCVNIGLSKKGLKLSEEHKEKISLGNKGLTVSKEGRRRIANAKKGKNNPNWLDGKSFERYTIDWTITLRKSIRERDSYTCQICGKPQNTKRQHSIHHIDYNKKNCNPDNLITLCVSCHGKTNKNRDKWRQQLAGAT